MIFNSIFTSQKIDAVMVPVNIPPERLREGIQGLKALEAFMVRLSPFRKVTLAAICDELGTGARAVCGGKCCSLYR